MIGCLVNFLYAEDPTSICVILRQYDKRDLSQDEDLYLIYDFNYKDYYYAGVEELSFIHI